MTIDDIRNEIDQLDNELLKIFNRRAELALAIGNLKKELDLPIYDPGREKRIFAKMNAQNPGPLDNNAIKRLFERVIDESRTLERIKTKGL
ncbi:MAG: chorismate mutase [Desulfuromonas sp.]|nr:chorismate mutase [Desulfuromonas sp.]